MKKIHISSLLNVKNPGHKDFDFVDINMVDDQKLFIDPCLISLHRDEWCVNADTIINSFFDEFYSAYFNNDHEKKHELLSHAGEVNFTKLGYGNGNNGHGKTAGGLIDNFKPLEALVLKIDTITNVIPRFYVQSTHITL